MKTFAGMAKPGLWTLGLVGHPIAQSLSPVMHEAALRHASLAGSYGRFETIDPFELAAIFARLQRGELSGLNVTVPHKIAAYLACDRHSALAEEVGAVNTLVRAEDSALVGWNTDLPGLVAAVRLAWPDPVPATRPSVLVVGAGGAAPAAMLAAKALGASDVRVWNRTFARAEAMVAKLGFGAAVADARVAAADVALVIQASSHGMGLAGHELATAEREAEEIIAATASGARVVDLVYRPRLTAWVSGARRLGRDAVDGLEMLVQQAALAFELWTGRRTSLEATSRAAPELVAVMRSAALSAAADGQTVAMSR